MWHSPTGHAQHSPQCSMDFPPGPAPSRRLITPLSPLSDPPACLQSPSPSGSCSRHCSPQSPPHARRPLLNFPPPPAYPPPHPNHPHHHHHPHQHPGGSGGNVEFAQVQVHQPPLAHHLQPIREDLCMAGPSRGPQPSTSWDTGEIIHPNDYSYAYYEPGPPTKHTNVPHRHPITGLYRDRVSRHTYLTRYGTEENIYEEISDVARARLMMRPSQQQSLLSLNQSIIEEEVRRVQHRHRKVLGELNLSVEAMLMPNSSSQDSDTDKELDDQLADLLTVGPTDELLSPAPPLDLDSGFSGSSSGTSYVGSMRRPERFKASKAALAGHAVHSAKVTPNKDCGGDSASGGKEKEGKGFWSRKGWKKLPGLAGLGSGRSSNGSSNCTVF